MRVCTYRKHLHYSIISTRGKLWAHKTSSTPPLFIEVHVPCHESESWCINMSGYRVCLCFCDFETVLTVCNFFLFYTGGTILTPRYCRNITLSRTILSNVSVLRFVCTAVVFLSRSSRLESSANSRHILINNQLDCQT